MRVLEGACSFLLLFILSDHLQVKMLFLCSTKIQCLLLPGSVSSLCTNRCKSCIYSMKILCSKCTRWQCSFWITAEPLLHHDHLIQKTRPQQVSTLSFPGYSSKFWGSKLGVFPRWKTASWLFEPLLPLPLRKVLCSVVHWCSLLLRLQS